MAQTLLFVGGSNRKLPWLPHADSPGISCYRIDEETGAFSLECVQGGIDNPTFLAISPNGHVLAAVSEVPEWDEGTVTLYHVLPSELRYINKQGTRGDSTAHVSFHPEGRLLAVANYSERPAARSVAVYRAANPLAAPVAFAMHSGGGPHPERQARPHPHCVRWAPNGQFLAVTDLGTDKVHTYRLTGDDLHETGAVKLPPGSGPRHIVFHPLLPRAYVNTELTSEIAILRYREDGLDLLSMTPAIPPGTSSLASGIAIAPDGGTLVVGNRGPDTLSVFTIGGDGGLTLRDTLASGGRPRDLSFSPSGRLLAVANQDTGRIALFRAKPDGTVTHLPPIPVGTPTVIAFAPK